MKNTTEHPIQLTTEADEILERRKRDTGLSKRIIANRIILEKGRRWYPQQEKQE
jgi:hypothetical protein